MTAGGPSTTHPRLGPRKGDSAQDSALTGFRGLIMRSLPL